MAVNAGVKVIATTRSRERFAMLEALGVEPGRGGGAGPVQADRRGQEARRGARPGRQQHDPRFARTCSAAAGGPAWPGGWAASRRSHDFNPLLQMASGVYLTFFGSFVFGTPGFPLSDVPLQAIAADVAAGRYQAKPSRVFRFEDIREAHRVMDANQANGKMVVVV